MPSSTIYLIRFDDICATMNWEVWTEIEQVLSRYNIKPIVAIVPDNRDSRLMVDKPSPEFWNHVRIWQSRGWGIALHGYQHLYVNHNPGIMRLTLNSEFAGLPREIQSDKIQKALAILNQEGVRADCWVAPSHSFDWVTVDVLVEKGIHVISDGLWPWPHTDTRGVTWVPQQLWGRLKQKRSGVWTACYHHNGWSRAVLDQFRINIEDFASQISTLSEVAHLFAMRPLTFRDQLAASVDILWNHRAQRIAKQLLRPLR